MGATTRFEAKFIQKMELLVLSTLSWRVAAPTAVTFLEHFLRALGDATPLRPRQVTQLRAHGRAVLRACLPAAPLVGTPPSVLATAALHHALRSCAPNSAALRAATTAVPLRGAPNSCLAALGRVLGPQWAAPPPGCHSKAPATIAHKPAVSAPAACYTHGHHHGTCAATTAAALRAAKPPMGPPGAGWCAERDSPTSTLAAGDLFADLDLDGSQSPGRDAISASDAGDTRGFGGENAEEEMLADADTEALGLARGRRRQAAPIKSQRTAMGMRRAIRPGSRVHAATFPVAPAGACLTRSASTGAMLTDLAAVPAGAAATTLRVVLPAKRAYGTVTANA